jgi:hypothetical protein
MLLENGNAWQILVIPPNIKCHENPLISSVVG